MARPYSFSRSSSIGISEGDQACIFDPFDPPTWARRLGFSDYFGIRHRLAETDERVAINRRAGEITISFSGDTNQAAQFARSVPDFVLKGRFADLVKLDLHVFEQEMGFAGETTQSWWRRLIRR